MLTGLPINIGAANKTLVETDIPANPAGLQFQRTYNSLNANPAMVLGVGWQHIYNLTLTVDAVSGSSTFAGQAAAFRADGRIIKFAQAVGSSSWVSDPDVTDQLQTVTDGSGNITGYQLTDGKSDRVESYDTNGKLTAINDPRTSQTLRFAYDSNLRLQFVTDRAGRQLQIGYDSYGRISDVWQPEAILGSASSPHWQYGYDANNNLATVTTPSGTTRTYAYENTSFVNALTGIVDEKSNRYVTYTYDSQGSASGENLWSGPSQTLPVGQYTIVDQGNNLKQVTDPLGLSSNFQFKIVQGVAVLDNVSQPCAFCGGPGMIKSRGYDATTGFTNRTTDFNGNVTTYNYNTRGLLAQRVEASSTTSQRTSNTTWNANFHIPDQRTVLNASTVTESLTKWAYNSRGQVLSRCEVDPVIPGALSYTCGALTNAPLGVRQTSYTYCEQPGVTAGTCPLIGLVLTVDGPRTDVSDVTTYTYYQTTDLSGCAIIGGACHYLGDLLQVTNAAGQNTTFVSYDKNGRITRQSDANGTLTDFTYHPRGWLLTRTVRANADGSASSNDATTTFAYDNVGNVTQITQPDQTYLHYVYDTAHRLTDIYDSTTPSNYLNGNHIHYTLDAVGNRTQEDTKDPSGTLKRTLSRLYDQLNRLTKSLNAAGATVQQYTNPVEAPPSGITYTNGYDGNGNAVYSVDGNSVGTEQQYDPLNRLVKTLQDHAGTGATKDTTTQYAYDARDNLRSVSDPDGLITNYTYDGLNNLTQLQSPDTGTSGYTYDAAGNRLTQTDARGVVSNYTYDALNRLTGIAYPSNSALSVTYAYDQANSLTGCATSYPLGRLTKITDASGSTAYCYDRRGNVTSKTQVVKGSSSGMPNTATNWALAGNGGVASASSTYTPASGYPVTGINDGDRTGRTWGNGGGWNDNTAQTFPDWVEIDFKAPQSIGSVIVYTLQNNFPNAVEPTDTTTFSSYGVTAFHVQVLTGGNWVTVGTVTGNNLAKRTVTFAPTVVSAVRVYCDDSADHYWSRLVEVEAWSSDATLVTQTAYTVADRIATITYPSGASVNYTRDTVGRVTSVSYKANPTAAAVTLANGITYYPFGPANALTYGNGRTITKTYDTDYAIHAVASSDGYGVQLGPTIDVMGNMVNNSPGTWISPPTHTYSYDPLYRLTKVADANLNPLATYSYNNTGDRLSMSSAGQSSTYTYVAGTHRLTSTGGPTRTYDNNGNLQTSAATGGYPANQWTYDERNRMATALVTASGGATTSAVYNYNGKGERVVKSVTGGTVQNTVFLYGEGGQLLGEYAAGSGSVQGEYIYLEGVPLGYASAGQLYYLETDHLGTARRVILPGATTASDTIVWRWGSFGEASGRVNMFGELVPAVQTVAFNLRFPGQYYDSETGLNYNYFRDYEPATGRYVEADPSGLAGGINIYAYANSGPLVLTDETGLDYWKENGASGDGSSGSGGLVHQRICVGHFAGARTCISFAPIDDSLLGALKCVFACDGRVYEDFGPTGHIATPTLDYRITSAEVDKKILNLFTQLENQPHWYNIGLFNCRLFIDKVYYALNRSYGGKPPPNGNVP